MLTPTKTRPGIPSDELSVRPERRSSVVVVGGGMAGIWSAYQLAKAGIKTILITYQATDRGGAQGASRRSAGALNTSLLTASGFAEYLQQVGQGQTHPSVAPVLSKHLQAAVAEFQSLIPTKAVNIGVALASGAGENFLEQMYARFKELGGEIMDAWVTRLVADGESCRGVQYESADGIGKIRCRAVIIASGGYAGLFANTVKTNCHGAMLGAFLQAGGLACNLEFLFKHGYGNFDTNSLTPTEELPGAEVYDKHQQRATWLEQLLFKKQGTKTHLQAVQFWLRNPETEFFVDLSYRPLYLKVRSLNDALEAGDQQAAGHWVESVVELVDITSARAVRAKIADWIAKSGTVDYEAFGELKAHYQPKASERFRVRPVTYFSMGGLGHIDFATNLKHVYAAGEAMHDFGANRVGGLPWSLYLASGYVIADQIKALLAEEKASDGEDDFELLHARSRFDADLLQELQHRMYACQEKSMSATHARETIAWMREKREALQQEEDTIPDGIAWLLVAEAILQASVARTESRGFFFRLDHQEQEASMDHLYSCAWYDRATDEMHAKLAPWEEIAGRIEGAASISSCH